MRAAGPLAALALAALLVGLAPPSTPDTAGVAVAVSGPDRLEVSAEAKYNIRIYGPAEVRWGFSVNMTGRSLEGGSITSPEGRTMEENKYWMVHDRPLAQPEFNITLTAPSEPGPIALDIMVHALEGAGAAGQTASARWSISVRAKRDVTINATVTNSGETRVEGLVVAFYVRLEGEWVHIANQSIPVIEPGGRENVSAVWNASLVDNGEYRVRIVIDPERKKVQFFSGSTVLEKTLVLRDPGEKPPRPIPPGVVVLVAMAVVGGGASVYYWYRKRKIV